MPTSASLMVGCLTGQLPGKLAQYTMAFQPSIATVTLGAPDVSRMDSYERVFSIVFLILGLLASSLLVSMLCAFVVDMRTSHKDRSDELLSLRGFLHTHRVSLFVAWLVQKQGCARQKESVCLQEDGIPALELVTPALRLQLQLEITQDHLTTHGLFEFFLSWERRWFIESLMRAIKMKLLTLDGDVFFAGVAARAAYCLAEGSASHDQEEQALDSSSTCPEESW